MTKSAKIRKLLAKDLDVAQISKRLKIPANYVYTVKWLDKKKKPSKIIKAVKEVKQALDVIEMRRPKHRLQATETDLVNHPPHYKSGGVETIDFIEAKDLNYRLGNVVKYVSRAGKKESDPIEDLKKAAWYLQREITVRENA